MTTKEELQGLLERVEKATGPDREIDVRVAYVADYEVEDFSLRRMVDDFGIEHAMQRVERGFNSVWRYLPEYTASIEVALALVERVLPGQHWTLGRNVHHHYWLCTFNELDDDGAPRSNGSSHAAPTPPLAILSALLEALIAQKETE